MRILVLSKKEKQALHDFFLWRGCGSYNDCPTYQSIKGKNPYINMYRCRCNPWIYRKIYWNLIYPLGERFLGWYDQEAIMRRVENDFKDV